jgi:glutamyl-tRNA reductase
MPLSDSPVFCVGVSLNTASLDTLERFNLTETEVADLLRSISAGRRGAPRTELILLSTCNRTEAYGVVLPGPDGTSASSTGGAGVLAGVPEELIRLLTGRTGLPRDGLARSLFRHQAGGAERHLFRVITGQDSLIRGETQIIGQVSRAYAAAQLAGTAGPVLSLLFESAIRASKRTRLRSANARLTASVSSAAVARAAALAGPLSRKHAVLIGTGEMGWLVLSSLRDHGAARIDVVTRNGERAAALSRRWGIAVRTIADLPELLAEADIVVSSTSSSTPLVTELLVREAVAARADRDLLLVDIAVPRTIEMSAGSVAGVRLLDIDSLRESRPAADDPVVSSIIEEELATLRLRMAEVSLRPVIGGMWRKAERIRREVLARTRARVPQLDDNAWAHIENLAHALVAKLLHDPATRLRAEAGNGHARAYADAIDHLFALRDTHRSS